MVEEYCSGGTLEQRLERQRGKRLDAETTAVVFRQMLRGTLCCHVSGMAHRDLKPDNFMFQSEDHAAAIKLIDFGLSHHPLAPSSEYINMAGTLEHTAPETFPHRDDRGNWHRPRTVAGEGGTGQASDVWSLGVIFFQMLTGDAQTTCDAQSVMLSL